MKVLDIATDSGKTEERGHEEVEVLRKGQGLVRQVVDERIARLTQLGEK